MEAVADHYLGDLAADVFEPLFKAVPALGVYGVKQGILAAVLVALVAWVIMPRYTRLLHGWLFASSSRREIGP